MAKGQTKSVTVTVNNMNNTTVSKTLELVVVNGLLVPDNKELNPGVNSISM